MPQAFPLQTLLELMQSRTDEATRKLGQLISTEQSQRSRLDMLEQYREEYAQRLRNATNEGITRLILRNYQEFLARIDEAIEQQRLTVQSAQLSTKTGQNQWAAQNKQLKAIDTLSVRHDARERYRENKLEQKLMDEFSSRKYSTKDPSDQ